MGYIPKALIAAIAFGCLFYFSDISSVYGVLQKADYRLVAGGTLIFLFGQYLAAQRWRAVLRFRALAITNMEALRLNLIGTFVGNFLPGQGSGDLAKCALLFDRFPDHRSFLVASVVYDRVLGLAALLSLAWLGVLARAHVDNEWSVAVPVTVAVMLPVAILLMMKGAQRFRCAWRLPGGGLMRHFSKFSAHLVDLLRNPTLLRRTFLLGIVFQLSWAVSVWLMLCSVYPSTPFGAVMVAAPTALLIAAVPVSLGGLGVREGAFSLLMQRFGLDADVATAGALLTVIPLLLASFVGAGLALTPVRERDVSSPSSPHS